MYRENSKSNSPIVVVGVDGWVLGLDADTGNRVWERQLGLQHVEVLVHHETVFAAPAAPDKLFVLSYLTGELLSTIDIPGLSIDRPTLLLERSLLFLGKADTLTAVDVQLSQVRWQAQLPWRETRPVSIAVPGGQTGS